MALFVDLDDSDDDQSHDAAQACKLQVLAAAQAAVQLRPSDDLVKAHEHEDDPDNVSGAGFAAALTCYPIAFSLSSHLDLNDLYALSLTSHSIHRSLSQYARQLISTSLRCSFDTQPRPSHHRMGNASKASDIGSSPTLRLLDDLHFATYASLSSAHKISDCARDLVQDCRKCGTIVCRNCVVKAPSDRYLGERHRRLCRTCQEAPLSEHLEPFVEDLLAHDSPPTSSASSSRSVSSASVSSSEEELLSDSTSELCQISPDAVKAFIREPCACATRGVYLCVSCGHNLRANDTTYRRVWTWRSRYSTHIGGGLGTGLGGGNQGQKCGRGEHCLSTSASSISWVEIDCSEGSSLDLADIELLSNSRVGTPTGERGSPGPTTRPGYLQQEMEGIGGVVKKKIKKRVKTGATVWEYDDERKTGKYLDRETRGKERSWCGWCDRVCLGEKDREVVI